MTAYYCRECLINEVPPTARDGRCNQCRPSRRHSPPRTPPLDGSTHKPPDEHGGRTR